VCMGTNVCIFVCMYVYVYINMYTDVCLAMYNCPIEYAAGI